ncbi:MAG: hypothetical protein ABEJ66_02100, partial [Candidatus Nanohaloarchaea archaeon]
VRDKATLDTRRIEADNCGGTYDAKWDCEDTDGDGDTGCTISESTYYTKTTNYYASNFETNVVDIKIERVTTPWPEQKQFDTNDAETSRDAKNILFKDDPYSGGIDHISEGGEGYYSVEKSRDSKEQG